MTVPTPLQVLITRPLPHGAELCREVNKSGYVAISFPTIVFAPPSDVTQFKQGIAQLGEQDWLIFISPQAAAAALPPLHKAWPHLPDSVKFAAVGAKTAQIVKEAGYTVSAFPPIEGGSEALLAMPVWQEVRNKKIAIISGGEGRQLLEQSFRERGAHVIQVTAYQRQLPKVEVSAYRDLIEKRQIHAIVCTSFEGVRNLKTLLSDCWLLLKKIPLIVVSERIKILAHDLGFQTIWVAAGASHEAIIKILTQVKDELWQKKSSP